MATPSKVRVLNAIYPHLAVFKAYNPENFQHNHKIKNLKSICFAFAVTVMVLAIPVTSVLSIALLFESDDLTMLEVVAVVPIVLSILYVCIEFVALSVGNRIITETIARLQNVVNQRKCHSISQIKIFSIEILFWILLSLINRVWWFIAIASISHAVREKAFNFHSLLYEIIHGHVIRSAHLRIYADCITCHFWLSTKVAMDCNN